MILRHMTHRQHMKSIVTRGGLSPAFQVDAPEGSIAFEVNPSNDAYRTHFHQLKTDWADGDVVTLEFDGERMQAAGFNILQPEEDTRSQQAERLGLPLGEIGAYAFIRNFVSLDFLTESSREQVSEYY